MAQQPIEVFFSYSREDKPLRDKLEVHLSSLKRQGVISAWHDRQIVAGSEWEEEIDRHMRTADIILLLLSPDFVNSPYCYDTELPVAMARHEVGEACVVPILLRPIAGWKRLPFARLQVYPSGGKAITEWTNRDSAFVNVAEGIQAAVDQLLQQCEQEHLKAEQLTRREQGEQTKVDELAQVEKQEQAQCLSRAKVSTQLAPKALTVSEKILLKPIVEPSVIVLSSFEFEAVTVDVEGKEMSRIRHQANYFEEGLGAGITLDMVAIPGGKFQMGSDKRDREQPIHLVTVDPFLVGKFAVTQAQYQAMMGHNPSRFKGKNHPVEQVSWEEAIVFCQRLSQNTGKMYRLLSEAEWEYACRAGSTALFCFGRTITTNLVNYNSAQTTTVGSFLPNLFGLYDMHGNVSEWCLDHWHKDYTGSPINGSAWLSRRNNQFRVSRGGSWCDLIEGCGSAFRSKISSNNREQNLGFRVASPLLKKG